MLPHRSRIENLDRIASLVRNYDVVALQECDGGSIRSGYINQVQYLAEASGIPTGVSSSTATWGRWPSTATVCSAGSARWT